MSNEKLLTFNVLTPEGIILEKANLLSMNVILADGRPIGIRPGHAPLIAATINGAVSLRDFNDENEIQLHAGILEIRDNSVTIVTAGLLDHEPSKLDHDLEYSRLMQTLIAKIASEER